MLKTLLVYEVLLILLYSAASGASTIFISDPVANVIFREDSIDPKKNYKLKDKRKLENRIRSSILNFAPHLKSQIQRVVRLPQDTIVDNRIGADFSIVTYVNVTNIKRNTRTDNTYFNLDINYMISSDDYPLASFGGKVFLGIKLDNAKYVAQFLIREDYASTIASEILHDLTGLFIQSQRFKQLKLTSTNSNQIWPPFSLARVVPQVQDQRGLFLTDNWTTTLTPFNYNLRSSSNVTMTKASGCQRLAMEIPGPRSFAFECIGETGIADRFALTISSRNVFDMHNSHLSLLSAMVGVVFGLLSNNYSASSLIDPMRSSIEFELTHNRFIAAPSGVSGHLSLHYLNEKVFGSEKFSVLEVGLGGGFCDGLSEEKKKIIKQNRDRIPKPNKADPLGSMTWCFNGSAGIQYVSGNIFKPEVGGVVIVYIRGEI